MSDPMTNSEVEDVLASIRRLVSDEKRQEPKSAGAAVTDRLVLTPSLRVMADGAEDTADPEPAAVSETPDQTDAVTRDADSAVTDTVDDGAQDDFALARLLQKDFAEFQTAETDASPMPAGEDDIDSQWHSLAEDEHDDHAGAEPHLFVAPAGDGENDATLHMDEDAVDDEVQDWPSVSDGTPEAQHDLGEGPVVDDLNANMVPEGWARKDAPFAMGDETAYLDGVGDALAATAAKTLSEKVAALETLVGKGRDNFEPDDTGKGANAGTEPPAMEWEDTDVAQDQADADAPFVEAEPEDAPQEPPAQIFSRDEDVLDEETLRDLVSDIVREELQGALGERITRNVRKLVRREIHRALAAQDLE